MAEVGKKIKQPASTPKDSFAATCSRISNGIISLCVFILMVVFPLIYDKAYTNIMDVKYICYYVSIIGMVALLLLSALVMAIIDIIKYKGEHTKKVLSGLLPCNWKRTFLVSDVFALLFGIAVCMSTFHSKYFYESFWGNEGRYSGMFLLSLYVIAYLIISRFWKLKGVYLELFLISGMIMCVIGITDYFRMDVLDFRGPNVDPAESDIFTSTIGNINSYTAYIGMVMGCAASLFIVEKKGKRVIWYYICMTISFFAIIMGCSDNAYLAIVALFGLLPFVVFGDRECVKRYLVMLSTFFTVILCIDQINKAYERIVIGLDSLFRVITSLKILPYVVILLWVLTAVFWRYDKRCSSRGIDSGKRFLYVWGIISAVVLLAVGVVLFDANMGGHPERYEAASNYLIFSQHWGTNRGYIWGASLKLFSEFSWAGKLLGHGPDTFGIMTMNEIPYEMVNATGQFYDSAHNEYIQYLVTIGIAGLVTYLGFLISAFWYMWRNWKENLYIVGAFGAVLCYVAQATINISLPLVAPMMWLLLTIAISECRKVRKRKTDKEGAEMTAEK